MKMYKLIFLCFMMTGTFITISAYSWLSMWMGLEINLLSIIPLLSMKTPQSTEASMKYFIIQAAASSVLLMAVILMLSQNELVSPLTGSYSMMMNSALLMKMGMAPFHFWFPEVMEGLNWMNSMIMLTWQKIAPMMIISTNNINMMLISFTVMSSLIISVLMVMNQISLRKIMAFSSINHMAWMILAVLNSLNQWTIYFTIYSLTSINIILIFMKTNSLYLSQLSNTLTINKMTKIILMINFLSLGGLPPFIGFLPKWLVINSLISLNLNFMALITILFTLGMIYIYIRVISTTLMINSHEPKMKSFYSFIESIVMISTLGTLSLPVLITLNLN